MVGRVMTSAEVLDVVLRDRAYYTTSGGGMTLSGGDPLMQPEFAKLLLTEAKARGLHTAVETSGYAMWGSIRPLIPLVDLWLYDYKETDRQLHQKYVGKPNDLILSNLKRLYSEGARIQLRCPIIPGHNARRDHLDGIVSLVRSMPKIESVELLPYYDLWRAKLERFGLKTQLPESVKAPNTQTVNGWNNYLRARRVPIVGSIQIND
jgi:pyruvate formate lyase activating enzyme